MAVAARLCPSAPNLEGGEGLRLYLNTNKRTGLFAGGGGGQPRDPTGAPSLAALALEASRSDTGTGAKLLGRRQRILQPGAGESVRETPQ